MTSNDRRASYMSAPRPRVVSNRVDADKSRGAASPLQSDNMDSFRNSTSSQKHRSSRDQKTVSEKRTERSVITTREKAVRRNPVKESSSAANRGDWEKTRSKKMGQVDGASPNAAMREQGMADSWWSCVAHVALAPCETDGLTPTFLHSAMGSACIADSPFDCSSRLSCICSSIRQSSSAVAPSPPFSRPLARRTGKSNPGRPALRVHGL